MNSARRLFQSSATRFASKGSKGARRRRHANLAMTARTWAPDRVHHAPEPPPRSVFPEETVLEMREIFKERAIQTKIERTDTEKRRGYFLGAYQEGMHIGPDNVWRENGSARARALEAIDQPEESEPVDLWEALGGDPYPGQ